MNLVVSTNYSHIALNNMCLCIVCAKSGPYDHRTCPLTGKVDCSKEHHPLTRTKQNTLFNVLEGFFPGYLGFPSLSKIHT